ncbi:plasmid stabilization protein [Picosynechococcus sp. PCC 7003]|uniref:type II toxin-antitoxin system RelE family toxin n=1 Tax=Picosynechococcus sp. PCC 7003 TaxID=374981 RepID=UPI0008108218|nr:type II toxin-antitoxin system RelE/ParE family toxin [Picosynechococcus sp. PCC 7003]ANV83883.1 plasmid stabilization protein [Picosynechococcus sp. PCC 7003]
MEILFESHFQKDLKKIKDKKIRQKAKEVILQCKQAEQLNEINNLKKMQGYQAFYRIRLGDYRIGIEFLDNTLIFTRFLHRKEIYRFFP